MRRVLLLTALLALLAGETAVADERRIATGDLVRFEPGLDYAAERVAEAMPGIRETVAERLGLKEVPGPAEIVLVRGHDAMRREASGGVPDWAAGVCVGGGQRIVLRIDLLTPESPLRSIQTTLRHEWVHLAWARRAGPNVRRLPLWFEEGLAEEVGGGASVDLGRTLDIAAAFDHLIPFEDLRTWPADAERAALAYRQGQSFVTFFVRERSWEDLAQVLARLADGAGSDPAPEVGGPFEAVVYEQTGIPLDQWIARWRSRVEEDARPWFHLLGHDIGWTLLVLTALLSVGASFFVRRRRRRAIDALPEY